MFPMTARYAATAYNTYAAALVTTHVALHPVVMDARDNATAYAQANGADAASAIVFGWAYGAVTAAYESGKLSALPLGPAAYADWSRSGLIKDYWRTVLYPAPVA